ncbi:MAG: hypothetical protein EBY16_00615 [Gammaproteobacteria bacterium]|nr:hypothetical protein [Gammaproteobacteria bacterium]
MKTIIKLLPLILSINLGYGQEPTYTEAGQGDETQDSTTSILEKIEDSLLNLGSYLGYDLNTKPSSNTSTTDTLLDGGTNQKSLENTTIQMYFGFINTNLNYPYFIPNSSGYKIAEVFNALCGKVFDSDASFTPPTTRAAIDLQYSSNGSDNAFVKNPVSQYLYNMLYITPNDGCIEPNNSPSESKWKDYTYCEGTVLANALGLEIDNDDLKNAKTNSDGEINLLSTNIAKLALINYYPQKNPSTNSAELLKQLDSTSFMGPLLYDNAKSQTAAKETLGLKNSNQLEAAQNYVRYITGGIMPKAFASFKNLDDIISYVYKSGNITEQMNYFKPFAKYILDFRIYASRMSLAVQNVYDSLAYRMNLNGNSSSSDTSQDKASGPTSQALNEYVMASYRLYNPNASKDTAAGTSSNPSLTTTAWQDMINTASPATVQKEMALILAEINYQLYQMRQQQEKIILTNSVFLLNNLTEPSLNVPSPSEADSSQVSG